MENIQEILKLAIDKDVSDIFIIAGSPLCFKIKGNIVRVNDQVYKPIDTENLISQIRNLAKTNYPETLNKNFENDFSFSLQKLGRFRVNTYQQRGSSAAVLRVVKFDLPNPSDYKIPEQVLNFSNLQKGLVLVTGSAGSGKSTTLACIVNKINENRNAHIVTIEDPIEYLHHHKTSIVSQREIAHDTMDYLTALRAALREAPNIILVGEMRDLETIQTALSAAETGHLVLSSLHTLSAAETINRIIDVFPASKQQQIRVQLAMVLQAVISQQLIPSKENELVPAFEIMTMTNAVRTQIRENKLHQIDNTIASSKAYGMIQMDESILKLFQDGFITKENALLYASNPEVLEKKLK